MRLLSLTDGNDESLATLQNVFLINEKAQCSQREPSAANESPVQPTRAQCSQRHVGLRNIRWQGKKKSELENRNRIVITAAAWQPAHN